MAAINYLLNDPTARIPTFCDHVGSDTSTLKSAINSTINLAPDTYTGGKADAGDVNSISITSMDPATVVGTNTITINDGSRV